MRKLVAELIGTFVLVFGGCGSAVFSAAFPNVGIGLLGVSLAFGLTVLGCAYGLGHVSGCHLNPAVTVGLCAAKRFAWKDLPGYVAAQLLGAALASFALLVLLKNGPTGYDAAVGGLAANGFGDHSPGHFGMGAALAAEVILTFIFMTVILGATSRRAVAGFAGIPIGLTLTLVHLTDRHPHHEPLGEPRAKHGTCALRGRLGARAALAFLARAGRGRCHRRRGRSLAPQGRRPGKLAHALN
jgi:aquaporin Z